MSAANPSAEAKRALLEKYLRNAAQRPAAPTATIPPRPADQPIPLSIGQQQLWFLSQLLGDAPAYNESATVHIPGPLDVPTLEASFAEVLRRHEAWRTIFALVDGQPVQRVLPPVPVSLPVVDLTHLPAAEREAEALRLAREEVVRPFDITAAPPWRATLVRLAEDSHRLYLAIHHIIFDGVAVFQVLLPELSAIYASLRAGDAPSLPPLPITYGDYAHWQQSPEQMTERARRMAHWRTQLATPPSALDLPTDRPRPPLQTFRGAVRKFEVPPELVGRLRTLGQREGATLYMVMLAALKVLLYRQTGQTDLAIGTASSGRDRSELQGLLGLFLNTLVLRTDLGGDPSFLDLLRRVRETTIAATANEVPFESLVQELRPERDLGRNPYFQVLITLEPDVPALPSGWSLTTLDVTTGTAKFDLSLKLDDRPSGLIGRFEYNTDLFDAATIDRLVGQFATLLAGIAERPAQAVATLPLLPKEQWAELRAWNATDAPFDAHCIHELVAAQAARTPGAVAVVHNGRTLTYAALEARANQMARYLRAAGWCLAHWWRSPPTGRSR
ncbi:MAG: condensation domain-containing protein [Chloroflexia bacterium]